jgi:hypothetical protein
MGFVRRRTWRNARVEWTRALGGRSGSDNSSARHPSQIPQQDRESLLNRPRAAPYPDSVGHPPDSLFIAEIPQQNPMFLLWRRLWGLP